MPKIRKLCPFCLSKLGSSGSRENLSIDPEQNTYKCYRCGSYGFITKRLAESWGVSYNSNFSHEPDNVKKASSIFRITSFKDISPLYDSIKSRGISDETLNHFGVSVCLDGTMKGLVFPVLDPLNKDGYVYKYNNTYINRNVIRDMVLYNGRILKYNDYVFVVEGPVDVIRLFPLPAIATLGKGISDDQIKRLVDNGGTIIFALDSDAKNDAITLVLRLDLFYSTSSYYVDMPLGKDPADCGLDEFLDLEIRSLGGNFGKVREFISY